jgi:hypothetical protein
MARPVFDATALAHQNSHRGPILDIYHAMIT